jgi:hypothetical protein
MIYQPDFHYHHYSYKRFINQLNNKIMTAIKELLDNYFAATAKVSDQLSEIERQEDEKVRNIQMPVIRVPNYAEQVIRPILQMLDDALPEYNILVPAPKECKLKDGIFQIRSKGTCLGGLSYPTNDDHKLYFSATTHRRTEEKQEVQTFEQLLKMIKNELNKRGLLILPKHL